jgi:hypothetical protein
MVSDPPYGVGYDPAWRNEAGVSSKAHSAVRRVLAVRQAALPLPPLTRRRVRVPIDKSKDET